MPIPKNLIYLSAGAIAVWYLFFHKSAAAAPAAASAPSASSSSVTGTTVGTTPETTPLDQAKMQVQQAAQQAQATGQVQAITTPIGVVSVTPTGTVMPGSALLYQGQLIAPAGPDKQRVK